MNGIDIADQARRLQPAIKVIYSTGYTESSILQNGKLEPGANLISKPYSRANLLGEIQRLLDGDT